MGKILILLLIFIILGAIWSLPLYICVNLVLWLFNIPFHLTWLQAFAVCLLMTVVSKLLGRSRKGG